MQVRAVLLRGEVLIARTGAGHTQRSIQKLFGNLFPGLTCGLGGSDRACGHAGVAVGVARAKVALRLQIAQAAQNLVPFIAEPIKVIARIAGKAAAVRVKVADRDMVRDPRVKHLKPRVEVNDTVIPSNHAVVD